MPNSTEFVYLVFRENGLLYFATSAAEIEWPKFANQEHAYGHRILKVKLPSQDELTRWDNGETCRLVQP